MEPLCEFCGVVKAFVYCKLDSARLCLQCDGCVHSANSLSRRHPRSIICDECHSQPATAHCLDEKMSLCQGCDLNPNGCSVLGHRCQALNCYTGCPSLAELSRMWPFVFYLTSSGGFNNGLASHSSLPVNDSCTSKSLKQPNNDDSFGLLTGKLNETEPCVKYEPWMEQSSLIPSNPDHMPYCIDQAFLFPQELNPPEASTSAQQDCVAFQSSGAGNPNCILMNPTCNRNINLGSPQGQVHSSISLSLSNITGESSATADYQDCGLSPVFLTSESLWESKLEATPQARDKAKMRYNEKKKTQIFGKQIRYASCKARADTRKRVKGRFVRAGEAYDNDPLVTKNI